MAKSEARPCIRVFLVDEHPTMLIGLRTILAVPDMEVVGEATTGQDALIGILSNPPDVVVTDFRLPDLGGGEVLKRIKEGAPAVAVVFLTAFAEPDSLFEAAMGGACGFLLKKAAPKEVLSLIRRVATGENCLSQEIWKALYTQFHAAKRFVRAGVNGGVTSREAQVLQCMARGLTNQAIADFLGISIDTVRFHSGHLFERLGVSDRTHAVAQAISKGVIAVPPGLPAKS